MLWGDKYWILLWGGTGEEYCSGEINIEIWENDFSNETSWTAPADATIDFTIIPIVDTTDGKTQTAGPVTILGGTTWIQKS